MRSSRIVTASRRQPTLTITAAALSLAPLAAGAAGPASWGLCATQPPPTAAPLESQARALAPLEVTAGRARYRLEQMGLFQGDVLVERADQRLEADWIRYNQRSHEVKAGGELIYREPNLEIEGTRAHWDLRADRARMDATGYRLPARHAHGRADTIRLLGDNRSHLTNVSYTTCEPGDVDWALIAGELELDRKEGVGEGRHVRAYFHGVPFFYTPYVSFPLDDRRKSGFLVPNFGDSSNSGTDISIPYYWNIAPNQDATFSPRYLAKRGAMLGTEYRYLTPQGQGLAYFEYLPDDDLFGDDRHFIHYRHRGRPWRQWWVNVNLNDVSDPQYFDDLGGSLEVSSQTHLPRRAETLYDAGPWHFEARVEGFQTIDESIATANRPYQRLPQFVLALDPLRGPSGFEYQFASELVQFERDESVTGTRLDVYPRISRRWGTPGYYVEPSLGIRHTQYWLDEGTKEASQRTLPVATIDSGVFFERAAQLGGRAFTHTLEPRLFYLYVPHESQSDLVLDGDGDPVVFDTNETELDFHRLFSDNRFTGGDRVGDANQLTAAVATRLLDTHSGREWLEARVGQIFYFRDREVTLPNTATATTSSSPVVADLDLRLGGRWSLNSKLRWDPHEAKTEKGVLRARYHPSSDQLVNLAYRRRSPNLEQTDLSLYWPVGHNWHVIGRWNYSLEDRRTLEAFAGLSYESCCWGIRVVGRRHVLDETTHESSIMVQVVLKGLTSVGEDIGGLLERGILGYREHAFE